MNTLKTILIAFSAPADVVARARRQFNVVLPQSSDLSVDQIISESEKSGAEGIIVSTSQKIDGAAIRRLPDHVKIVATCSVGFDHLDVQAGQSRGLILTNTPGVLTDCTADFTLMLLLSACRRAREYNAIMQAGWSRRYSQSEMLGLQVTGKTLGILGMGRIGRAVAQRARGFGITILYSNPRQLPIELEQGARYFSDFREMLPHCEILSLHAPANPLTNKIMNTETFALMPKQSVFVNTARGSLVDEDALIEALTSGHLFSAGLDVFCSEPNFEKRFIDIPNVILTPHMASATLETRNAMGLRTLDNVEAVLSGNLPKDPLW